MISALRIFLLCLLPALPLHPAGAEDITFPTAPLAITTQSGAVHFTVEVAITEAQHERGLMYRTSLAQDHGMIFEFITPQKVKFWMKNTHIPLDMVFISDKGIVTQIVERAPAESTDLISSQLPVLAVLELSAGATTHYHIAKGDKVLYSLFP